MPKYLAKARFTDEGMKGLQAHGAAARVEMNRTAIASLGGTLEAYYFAFGDDDIIAIVDLPDDEAATAASLTVNVSGTAHVTITKLLTAEQVDEALKRKADYRPMRA